jgi:TPR repeat protein
LKGHGVEKHEEEAMKWFKKAADQGHPEASYNLAVGHLKGLKTNINYEEAKRLIEHAAKNRVNEAKHTLDKICNNGLCEDD